MALSLVAIAAAAVAIAAGPTKPAVFADRAREVARTELAHSYEEAWAASTKRAISCPLLGVYIADARARRQGYPSYAQCAFQFSLGEGRWRQGELIIEALPRDGGLVIGDPRPTYIVGKRLRRCGAHSINAPSALGRSVINRRLWASGAVGCPPRYELIGDIDYEMTRAFLQTPRTVTAYMRGTNTAGLGAIRVFRCAVERQPNARYRAACRNEFGDRYVYSFSLTS